MRRRIAAEAAVERAINIEDLRRAGRPPGARAVFDYIDGAAGDELTLARNQSDLRALTVAPRVLAGGAEVDLSTTVLGRAPRDPAAGSAHRD